MGTTRHGFDDAVDFKFHGCVMTGKPCMNQNLIRDDDQNLQLASIPMCGLWRINTRLTCPDHRQGSRPGSVPSNRGLPLQQSFSRGFRDIPSGMQRERRRYSTVCYGVDDSLFVAPSQWCVTPDLYVVPAVLAASRPWRTDDRMGKLVVVGIPIKDATEI